MYDQRAPEDPSPPALLAPSLARDVPADVVDLEDPLTLWLLNHQRENTRRAYLRAYRSFAAWLEQARGKSDPTQATLADALLYREALLEQDPPLRGSSIRAQLAALSSFATHSILLGRARLNPWATVEAPSRGDKKPQRSWRVDELIAFMQAIPSPASAQSPTTALQYARDVALFWLLFRNGLRVNEVCGARLGDLERLEDFYILRVREHGARDQHVKRGEERVAVLKPETWATLRAYLERRGVASSSGPLGGEAPSELAEQATTGDWRDLPLFADTKRPLGSAPAPLSARQVHRLMRRYGERAGLERELLHPHAARRTAITTLAWRETSVGALQAFSGHKTVAAVQVYIDQAHHVRDNPALRMPY